MPDQTTPHDRLFALIASIPGSASVDWCDDARALVDEIATPPAPLPAGEARTRLLQALDAPYCQALGHTPEGLLAAYEASRTQTVDDSALSVAEARDRLRGMALTLATGEGPLVEPWAFNQALDDYQAAVAAAVLPATTNHDTDTSAVLAKAADRAEIVALRLRLKNDYGAANGAYEVMAELRRVADETAATETTADKAARLGMTPEEYRAHRHLAAVEQIRAALPGLYATTGLRVEAALTEPADETAATATQDARVQHAPGKAIRCPDCRGKGYTVCLDEPAAGARQDGTQR